MKGSGDGSDGAKRGSGAISPMLRLIGLVQTLISLYVTMSQLQSATEVIESQSEILRSAAAALEFGIAPVNVSISATDQLMRGQEEQCQEPTDARPSHEIGPIG